jgi:hypothetical protein
VSQTHVSRKLPRSRTRSLAFPSGRPLLVGDETTPPITATLGSRPALIRSARPGPRNFSPAACPIHAADGYWLAMSGENVEAFQRAVAAVNRGDVDGVLNELGSEVEWHPLAQPLLPSRASHGRRRDGRNQVKAEARQPPQRAQHTRDLFLLSGARHAAAAPAAAANPAAVATASSVGRRSDLGRRPEGAYGARAWAARAYPARPPSARPVRGTIVARTSTRRTVVHTRRYRTCARWALSQAAPLFRLRGQTRWEQS